MYDTVTQRRSPLGELEKADSERESKHRKQTQKTGTAELKPKSGKRPRQPCTSRLNMPDAGWKTPDDKCGWQIVPRWNAPTRGERGGRRETLAHPGEPWRRLTEAGSQWDGLRGRDGPCRWTVCIFHAASESQGPSQGPMPARDHTTPARDSPDRCSPDRLIPAQISPVQATPYPMPCLHPCVSARTIEAQAQLESLSVLYDIILYCIILYWLID